MSVQCLVFKMFRPSGAGLRGAKLWLGFWILVQGVSESSGCSIQISCLQVSCRVWTFGLGIGSLVEVGSVFKMRSSGVYGLDFGCLLLLLFV